MPLLSRQTPVPSARPRAPAAVTPGGRLRWLDALRGVAVLAVVAEHLTYLVFRPLRQLVIVPWFDSGKFGVMLFFLVSGYIIPASLERHGDVRRFWISRAFRLYPALIAAVGALLALYAVGAVSLDGRLNTGPLTALVAHATLLQDVLGVHNFLNVLWTLSYEMLFYLLTTALFVLGWQRQDGKIAVGCALGAVFLAPALPAIMLSHGLGGTRLVVATVAVLLAVGLPLVAGRRHVPRAGGAWLLGGLAVVLIICNQRAGMWEGLIILAAMFTGTTIYRAEHGQVSRRAAAATIGSVWVLAVAGGVWNFRLWPHVHGVVERDLQVSWSMAILAAGAVFAAGWLLRRRRFPRPLVWIGLLSYSIYLLHTVLLSAAHRFLDPYRDAIGPGYQALIAAVFVAVVLTAAWVVHRHVELPGQRLGRTLAARLPARTGG